MIADLLFDECNLKRPMKNSLKRQTLMGQTEQYHSNGSVFNRYAYGLESKCTVSRRFYMRRAKRRFARHEKAGLATGLALAFELNDFAGGANMPAMARPPAAQGLRHH